MAYLFLISAGVGAASSMICGNVTYHYLYSALYLPHKLHQRLKKSYTNEYGEKNIDPKIYVNYFMNVFVGPFYFLYEYLTVDSKLLSQYKQFVILRIVERFELVKESIDNYDDIQEIKNNARKKLEKSYSSLTNIEKEKSEDKLENSIIENLNLMKDLSKKDTKTSDFQKNIYENPLYDPNLSESEIASRTYNYLNRTYELKRMAIGLKADKDNRYSVEGMKKTAMEKANDPIEEQLRIQEENAKKKKIEKISKMKFEPRTKTDRLNDINNPE